MLHEKTLKNNRIDLKEMSPMSNTSRITATVDSGVSHHQPPRLEHLAFNVKDPQAIAQWYVDHLGMKIYRSGPPPGSTRFVGDAAGNLMFELYNNPGAPPLGYPTFSHMSMHVAFMVDDVKTIRDSLVAAGAKVVEDIATIPSGDQVLMMRDPFGLAIQFVMRIHPMLKPSGIRFEHLALNLSDPQKVTDWYLENLGFKVMRKGARRISLRLFRMQAAI